MRNWRRWFKTISVGKKKKRFNAATVRCRCCERRHDATGLTRLAAWLPKHKMYGDDVLFFAKNPAIPWVCDNCLRTGKALAANSERQNLGNSYTLPYFAYTDQQKRCATCSTTFLFSKQEQQYWYEELQIPVYGDAKNCKDCRKSIRDDNAEMTKLGDLISNLDPTNVKALEAIITIFVQWKRIEKARFYLSFIPKIAGFRNNEKLIAKHAQLKKTIQDNSPISPSENE